MLNYVINTNLTVRELFLLLLVIGSAFFWLGIWARVTLPTSRAVLMWWGGAFIIILILLYIGMIKISIG
ncbi:MAG: hypothetical protein NUV98_05475 [Candidatus Roizmanbacteria bacterium]|nr:hypothetical protein [Candidatus Roizmanbacteria bacterium]